MIAFGEVVLMFVMELILVCFVGCLDYDLVFECCCKVFNVGFCWVLRVSLV